MISVVTPYARGEERFNMRVSWRLSISLVALVLISCAMPGGIYKGYDGPDRDLKEIAVITWSEARVTRIDGKFAQEKMRLFGGVRNTIAHLPPGRHSIKISVSRWEDLYVDSISLGLEFPPGSYAINEDPCKRCDPFKIYYRIVDAATGVTLLERPIVGRGPYGEVAKERKRKEIGECESRCQRSCWRIDDGDERRECYEEVEECKDDCTNFLDELLLLD